MRVHGHPTLLQALKRLKKYEEHIEEHSPITKKSGIFFFTSADLARPEVVRHRRRLIQRYSPPQKARILLLLPQTQMKPLHKSKRFQEISKILESSFKQQLDNIHICFYAAPFGVIPLELDEVYPLSQHEIALPLDKEMTQYVTKQVADYIENTKYQTVVLIHNPGNWNREVLITCRETCMKEKIEFEHITIEEIGSKTTLARLNSIQRKYRAKNLDSS
jgi:7-cyano-7-deazaguanine tRNA-ribosyltransferase